jgi:1-acyl-sn-glycerol-3-phosphate acyltransferase
MRSIRASVRIVLFVLATLGLYGTWFLTHFFIPNKIHWRQTFFYYWTYSFIWASNMKVRVVGTPPKPPFFLVSNHLSYTDIAALRNAVPGVFVAKAEVKDWPVAGRICSDMGTIFIDRTNRRDIPRAGDEIIERLDAGEGVIVFPEGTSTKGEAVEKFNSSFLEFAARGDVPVSYASLTYETPDGETPASLAVCWWEDISFFAHLWRLMKIREYTATITFGDVPIQSKDRKELARELHGRVLGSFAPIA